MNLIFKVGTLSFIAVIGFILGVWFKYIFGYSEKTVVLGVGVSIAFLSTLSVAFYLPMLTKYEIKLGSVLLPIIGLFLAACAVVVFLKFTGQW